MGGRYFITGAQIGTIIALSRSKDTDKIEELINEITEKQFLGDRESFEKIYKILI